MLESDRIHRKIMELKKSIENLYANYGYENAPMNYSVQRKNSANIQKQINALERNMNAVSAAEEGEHGSLWQEWRRAKANYAALKPGYYHLKSRANQKKINAAQNRVHQLARALELRRKAMNSEAAKRRRVFAALRKWISHELYNPNTGLRSAAMISSYNKPMTFAEHTRRLRTALRAQRAKTAH